MRRITRQLVSLALLLLIAQTAYAQLTIDGKRPVYDGLTGTYLLTLPDTVFGGAFSAPVVIDAKVSDVRIDGREVTTVVDFPVVKGDTCYTLTFTKGGVITQSSLHFTYLPILCVNGTFGNDYVAAPVSITMPDEHETQTYNARLKWAGSSTNGAWTHKRSYHIKFVDEAGEKMDVSFFGLRNDNHWRLDAGTIDMLRIRNKVAHGLWADFGVKPYYADQQPKARSYVRGSHVEMFLNGEYRGFFDMTEYLDRKQLKLKKYDLVEDSSAVQQIEQHGQLWKAKEETSQTMFIMNTDCDSTLDNWAGFDLMYPDIEEVSPADYSTLRNAVDFVARSGKNDFIQQVGEYFDLPVLVNYYVFINTIFAIDNTCKNIIWGCYDSQVDKKLTLAVWDMDATAGQHWRDQEGYYHADAIQPENDFDLLPNSVSMMAYNRLFQRLKTLPDFALLTTNCYWRLRENVLDPDSLVARYESVYRRLENCGALAREEVRWSDTGDIAHRMLDFAGEFEYLTDWLRRRIAYMDTHTFACMRGDVNNNGAISIEDLTGLISYLLEAGGSVSINRVNADVNVDDQITISDVTALITLLMAGTN